MKILQIFGAVIAVHLLAFIFIFASPGCQSVPRNVPTPDETMPHTSSGAPVVNYPTAQTFPSQVTDPALTAQTPTDLGAPTSTTGRSAPTRPGSPNAAAIQQPAPVEDVAPVSTYTVQRGDSLWSIAKKNNLTVSELTKANNLSSSATLQPGKKLILPGKPASASDLSTSAAAAPVTETPRPARATNGESVRHTIQSGESLGVIARRYQVTVGELAAANNITDPAKIRAGQQLVIPGFRAVGSRAAAATNSGNTASAPAPVSAPVETPSVSTSAPATVNAAPSNVPVFEIKAPPPGQDLDAGLNPNTSTDVPTIKIEEPKENPKN